MASRLLCGSRGKTQMDTLRYEAARLLRVLLIVIATSGVFAKQASSADAAGACDIRAATEAIRQHPRDANSYVIRAACLRTRGPGGQKPPLKNTEAAVRDLEVAIKLDPRNFFARHNYAYAAYLLGYAQFAVAEFTEAISLDPKAARSYVGRGWVYLESCQLKEATPDFQRAVSLDASLQTSVATRQEIVYRQSECARSAVPAPNPVRSPSSDPYLDHSSDYWRQRNWEERPH
jgi:tetratricopeptide (TPR) repeat protein